MAKPDTATFSKTFQSIQLMSMSKEDIPVNLVDEKRCRKIPKIKSFNSAMAVAGTSGVYVRDSTCYDCPECLSGERLLCQSEKNGKWFHHNIKKCSAIEAQDVNDCVTDEEECVYDSEIDDEMYDDNGRNS